jgi:hypothetical protein
VRLINYTSAKGDKLQGASYPPANYELGSNPPSSPSTERSNLANTFVLVSETSTPNRSLYTSRSYAGSILTSSTASTTRACRRCGA